MLKNFAPPSLIIKDWRSQEVNYKQLRRSHFVTCSSLKMGRPGFEPGTNRLKAEYSTVELATR